MNDERSPDQIVDAWIAADEAEPDSEAYRANAWAVTLAMDWALTGDPEPIWAFVAAAGRRDLAPPTAASLAAGPVEDMLSRFGPGTIDRAETLAREEPRFRRLLALARRSGMSDDVWKRVTALRNE
jgi:hypothetical protein